MPNKKQRNSKSKNVQVKGQSRVVGSNPKAKPTKPKKAPLVKSMGNTQITISPNPRHASGRRKVRARANKKHGSFKQVEKHLGPQLSALMKSVISPAENMAPCGWPDASKHYSAVINKIMHAVQISRPPAFTAESYSVVTMHVPSPEIALIVWYYDGPLQNDTPLPWDDQTVVGWTNRVIYWADVTRYTDVGESLTYNEVGVNSVQTVTVETTDKNVDPAKKYVYPTSCSDLSSHIMNDRWLGGSCTFTPSMNGFNNEGIVYSVDLQNPFRLIKEHAQDFAYDEEFKEHPVRVTGLQSLDNLPPNIDALLQLDVYQAAAYTGLYTVHRLTSAENPYTITATDRGVLAFGSSLSTKGNSNFVIPFKTTLDWPQREKQPTPINTMISRCWMPSVSVWQSLNKAATISVKVVGHIEAIPTQGSTLTYMVQQPPMKHPAFLELVEALSAKLEEGYPASANDFWTVLKEIGAAAWEVFKVVLPYAVGFAL